ncbi:MAG: hypoxanthine phosphoribosyltransferase [Candidatus Symbiodolus clandestinus]
MSQLPIQELISAATIQQRIAQLGATLTLHYQQSPSLLLVGLLRGSFIFLADLCRQIALPHEIDFMVVASYGEQTESSGNIRLLKDLESEVAGKDLLLVEDIVDSGCTLSRISQLLQQRSPRSLAICTLLDKPTRRKVAIEVQWSGFTIPDDFVVGYGLDYAQQYRHLDFIGIVKPNGNSSDMENSDIQSTWKTLYQCVDSPYR